MVRNWLRKIRGVMSLTLIGGLAGGLFGAAWAVVTTAVLGGGGLPLTGVVVIAAPWALIGAISSGGVALVIAAVGPRKSLEELSAPRSALLGAIFGAAAPLALIAMIAPGPPLAFLAAAAGVGAILAEASGADSSPRRRGLTQTRWSGALVTGSCRESPMGS